MRKISEFLHELSQPRTHHELTTHLTRSDRSRNHHDAARPNEERANVTLCSCKLD